MCIRDDLGISAKLLVAIFLSILLSEVHTVTVEWSFVSPYQLSQSQNNWYAGQGGNSVDIDLSKGGQVAFVPARYGLYNRSYSPREINLYLSKPKSSDERSSSEEHRHKRKHHRHHSSEDRSDHEHQQHHEHHQPEHHKSAKQQINDEHAEQAQISAQMADGIHQLKKLKEEEMREHAELRDKELSQGNVDGAKKEQKIVDICEAQINALDGLQKAEEAIMAGEVEMYYDDDGKSQPHHGEGHGHHGDEHHGHEGHGHHHDDDDHDDEGHDHANKHHHHHGNNEHEGHGHHGEDDGDDDHHDDGDDGYHNEDDDDHGHHSDDDDDDEGHGSHHSGDDDDEGHGGEGHDHHQGGDHEDEGHGHNHEGEGHGHNHEGEGHGHNHEGEGHGHNHEGEGHGHNHEGEGHSHNHEGEGHGHNHEGEGHSHNHEGEGHGHNHEGEDHGHGDENDEDKYGEVPIHYVNGDSSHSVEVHGHHNEDDGHKHHSGDDNEEFHDAGDHFDEDDTKNDPDYKPNKHKLDRRSPFVSSFFPSLNPTDTASPIKPTETATPPIKPTDSTTLDTTAQADASATAAAATNNAELTAEASANANLSSTTSSPSTPVDPSTTPTPDPSTTTSTTSIPDPSITTPTTTAASTTATSATTATTASNSESSSSWFSWFKSPETPTYSPYTYLQYLSPQDKSPDGLMAMFNVFSDPSNSSYLSNASTVMRIVMFFMPGTGIVDQVYFTMALSKIMWEAATMYYEGYGTTTIAVTVLEDLVSAAYLSRRGEDSIISQKILTPGETIKIDGMEVPAFLKYVHNMEYPALTEAQEKKLIKEIDNLVNITYPNISEELKTTFTASLKDTMKFLALFSVEGDLKVDNVDVNFSEVYISMRSAFDDSPIETLKKKILGIIDSLRSNFK